MRADDQIFICFAGQIPGHVVDGLDDALDIHVLAHPD